MYAKVGTDNARPPRYSGSAVWTLLDDLDAFYLEHRRCGELDAAVEAERVWGHTCSPARNPTPARARGLDLRPLLAALACARGPLGWEPAQEPAL
jgi:hypothetical protein